MSHTLLARKGRSGFTLIELLIVVAIIAILALIAVPNFLEAQVRAKVSRVENDLRTIAVAMEAYCVDWNDYPGPSDEGILVPWNSSSDRGLIRLTTPVPYLTSIPLDPFGRERGDFGSSGGTTGYGRLTYEMASSGCSPHSPKGWAVYSSGPDRIDDTEDVCRYPYDTLQTIVYDPTNGTISRGDIHRFGPQKFEHKIRYN